MKTYIILDLFFQIWLSELIRHYPEAKEYNTAFLYECYAEGMTFEQFYNANIYLPF